MSRLRDALVTASVLLAASAATPQAATITVGGSLNLTDLSSLPLDDGSNLPAGATTFLLGHESVMFNNLSKSYPEAGVYAGTFPSIAVSPYGGQSQSKYLVAQAGDPVAISLGGTYTEFGLLWGTVDSYNLLDFYKGGIKGTKVASISGDDVLPGGDNGTQNVYVMISGLPDFDTVVAVDIGQPAFEFAPDAPVPEPASVALLGVGLLGLGFTQLSRRRA
jgi:PEP-CTERM motif